MIGRKQDGTFAKGHSGNPSGRPKGSHSLTTILRQRLAAARGTDAESEVANEIVDVILAAALAGDWRAMKLLWNYADGLPEGSVERTVCLPD